MVYGLKKFLPSEFIRVEGKRFEGRTKLSAQGEPFFPLSLGGGTCHILKVTLRTREGGDTEREKNWNEMYYNIYPVLFFSTVL